MKNKTRNYGLTAKDTDDPAKWSRKSKKANPGLRTMYNDDDNTYTICCEVHHKSNADHHNILQYPPGLSWPHFNNRFLLFNHFYHFITTLKCKKLCHL